MSHSGRRAVLFDLDGTLIDSVPDIAGALNELMGLDELPPFSVDEVRRMIGRGVNVLVQRAYSARQFTPQSLVTRLNDMHEIYGRYLTGATVPMPGAMAVLKQLHAEAMPMALVTNKLLTATETIVDHFAWRPYFGTIIGDGAGLALKPAPDMLLAACERLGVSPKDAAMVGDSAADIDSARRAGIFAIVVRGGYVTEPVETFGADVVLDDLNGLLGALGR